VSIESFCTRAVQERFSTFSILQVLRHISIGIIVELRFRGATCRLRPFDR
jgi:hypothetical protein